MSGVVTLYRGRTQIANQEVELLRGDDADLIHTRAYHAGAPGVGRRHDADDPRAGVCGAPATAEDARSTPGRVGEGRIPQQLRPGAAEDPFPRGPGPARARAGAAEVRRAVHARAGGCVPQASRRGRAGRRRAHGLGLADRTALRNAPVRADRGAASSDRRGRRGDGAPSSDERAAPGRRRSGEDVGRGARGAHRDPIRAPGGDHGADRGPRRSAPAIRGGAARRGRRHGVPRSGAGHGEGRRAGLAPRSRAHIARGRVRHLCALDGRRHRQGPRAHHRGDRRRRDRPDDRDTRAGAGGRVVPRPVARRDRRAASVRRCTSGWR